MKIQRLIANDPEDCRGLINTLVTNGHVVWLAKVVDYKTHKTNTVVFYTPWDTNDENKSIRKIEVVSTEQLTRIRQMWDNAKELELLHDSIFSDEDDDPQSSLTYENDDKPIDERCPEPNCTREKDHLGKCLDKDGNMWFNPEPGKPKTVDEEDDKPEPEAEKDYYDPGSCLTYCEGVPCCLPRGHKGDHLYKCESPNCPGYTWPASVRPHPPSCYRNDAYKPESCPRHSDLVPCCLPKGHKGDHLYKCESPNCPGYPWPASAKRPHPTNTCKA